jgi:hypothetical protein
MKKLLVLLLVAGYCLTGIATEPASSWIMSASGKMDVKRINLGTFKARIVLENGKKLTIPIDQLDTYSVNGKVFNKLPLYKNGKPTGQMVFMELLKTQGELSLYRCTDYIYEPFTTPLKETYNLLIYKGDKLHLAVDEKSMANISRYFDVKIIHE